jgi:RNA polymerase sigma-70 factor (ECF subfamily)
MSDNNDEQLISQYLKGDGKSLEFLIQRYLKPIYSFVYHYVNNEADAEDITQEVFVKVWRNIRKFNSQNKFQTWLFVIAKNTAIDFLKKKKPILFSEINNSHFNNLLENITDTRFLPDEAFEDSETKKALNSAIDELSPTYRVVFNLRYYNQFSFRQIAESLGESINTVKSRYRRALLSLRTILTSDFPHPLS